MENQLPLGALGLNTFIHSWIYWVSYAFHPPPLVPLVLFKFPVEHAMGKFRILIKVVPCWMEVPWLSTVFNMLKGIPHQFAIIKDHIMDILVGWCSRVCHCCIYPLAAEKCVPQTGVLSPLYQAVEGVVQAYTTKI